MNKITDVYWKCEKCGFITHREPFEDTCAGCGDGCKSYEEYKMTERKDPT